MQNTSEVVGTVEDRTLILSRVFNAPRQLVFEACSQKHHLDQWMAPHGFHIAESDREFREGGPASFLLIAPDGEKLPMRGVHQKIVPNELIVMAHAWLGDDGEPEHWTTVTWRFADAGVGKTKMTLEQSVFRSKESRDRHNGGWSQCFDKLCGMVEEMYRAQKEQA